MENNSKIEEEQVVEVIKKEEKELDEAIDFSLATLPLDTTEHELMLKIINAPTKEELQTQFDLFNINQSKKNALRVVKLNNLLDKVEDQAIERFEKRPDQVSNKELLEYMNVISNQIDRAQKSVDGLKDTSAIHITNQKNELNINVGPQLNRDSKERVMDAIAILLKQVQKEPEIIEAEIVEEDKEFDNTSAVDTTENEQILNKLTEKGE